MKYLIGAILTAIFIAECSLTPGYAQSLNGTVLRLAPSVLSITCNNGDIRTDQNDSYKLKKCGIVNNWSEITPTGAIINPMTTAGDLIVGGVAGNPGRLGIGAANTVLTSSGSASSWAKILNANIDSAAAIDYSKLNLTGNIVNADVSGSAAIGYSKLNLAGSILNADVNNSAAIAYAKLNLTGAILNADLAGSITDSKLSTISTAGKVSNSATTATSANTASAIVARDGSGNFTAGTITANLTGNVTGAVTGNASTATALAADPADCSANQYATAINASGTLSCAQVGTTQLSGTITNAQLAGSITAAKLIGSDITTVGTIGTGTWQGTKVAEAYGGTNQNSYTLGDMLYASATNVLSKLGIGTTGQVLTVSASGIPGWAAATAGAVNYIKNPSGVANASDVTTSSASITRSTVSGDQIGGIASLICDSSAQNGYCEFDLNTINRPDDTGDCHFSGWYKGDATLYKAQLLDGSANVLNSTLALSSVTAYSFFDVTYPCGSSRKVRFTQTGAGNGAAVNLGALLYGPTALPVVPKMATKLGSIKWTGTTNCVWSTASTSFGNFSADTDCATPTVSGAVTAPGTKIPAAVLPAIPKGTVLLVASGGFYKAGVVDSAIQFRFSDGTNTSNPGQLYAGTGTASAHTISGSIDYSSDQGSTTINVQGRTGSASNNANIASDLSGVTELQIDVYWLPSSVSGTDTLAKQNGPIGPTQTKLTSSSGTYTTPAGVSYIRVRMVGGGGGGGGGGTGSGGAGGNGGDTTFGSSLLSAGGGVGGSARSQGSISAGGTSSLGTGPVGVALQGGNGSMGGFSGVSTVGANGGAGVSTPFGGSGGGGISSGIAGGTAITNSGSSGGGGGSSASATAFGGAAGGAGGYVDAIITNPSSSYSYAIGAAGTAGTAGTAGSAGGAGGSGYIVVDEYYGTQAPVVIGSITSGGTGAEREERANITINGASSAINTQSGTWISSLTNSSSNNQVVNMPSGTWSAAPTCVCTVQYSSANGYNCTIFSATTTTVSIATFDLANSAAFASTFTVNLLCRGPR